MKDYYEILEVNPKASFEVIQKTYKVLARKYHPDLQKTEEQRKRAEEKLGEINEAYQVLSDYFLREQYDRQLQNQQQEKEQFNYENYSTEKNQKSFFQKNQKKKENQVEEKTTMYSNVGTFAGLVDMVKHMYHTYEQRPKEKKKRKMDQKDKLAVILTIVCVIVIGIILWFIPFTNSWIRELTIENPLVSWIWK